MGNAVTGPLSLRERVRVRAVGEKMPGVSFPFFRFASLRLGAFAWKSLRKKLILSGSALLLCCACGGSAQGVEHVRFRAEGKEQRVDGRLEVTAQDGGMLVLGRDAR